MKEIKQAIEKCSIIELLAAGTQYGAAADLAAIKYHSNELKRLLSEAHRKAKVK